jgi:hypothetical protein
VARALELLDSVRPPPRPSTDDYLIAELSRALIGVEVTRAIASG